MGNKIRLPEAKKAINHRLNEPVFDLQGLAQAELDGMKAGRDIPTPYIDKVIKASPTAKFFQISLNVDKEKIQKDPKLFNEVSKILQSIMQFEKDTQDPSAIAQDNIQRVENQIALENKQNDANEQK